MEYESVNLYILAADTREGLAGVFVRVFLANGTSIVGEATTSSEGVASFLLPGTANYEARFYKFGVTFTQPVVLSVISNPATPRNTPNNFEILASVPRRETATDPRLCRASGYFRSLTGTPRADLTMHFMGTFQAALLEGSLVMDERTILRTDEQGFASIDLIRCANYSVTIENYEDSLRTIRVPDESSANLPDLLFAVVSQVQLDPINIAVGETVRVSPVVLDSAGTPLPGTAYADLSWTVDNPSIAFVQVEPEVLQITGLASGVASLLATRLDTSIVAIPSLGIQGGSIAVTVS